MAALACISVDFRPGVGSIIMDDAYGGRISDRSVRSPLTHHTYKHIQHTGGRGRQAASQPSAMEALLATVGKRDACAQVSKPASTGLDARTHGCKQ